MAIRWSGMEWEAMEWDEKGAGAGHPTTAAGFGCTCAIVEAGIGGTVPHGVCTVFAIGSIGVGICAGVGNDSVELLLAT